MKSRYPLVRPRLRVTRFGGGCSVVTVGEDTSDCFRFKEALDRWGVLWEDDPEPPAGVAGAPDGAGPDP
jgi:hypothetical protein